MTKIVEICTILSRKAMIVLNNFRGTTILALFLQVILLSLLICVLSHLNNNSTNGYYSNQYQLEKGEMEALAVDMEYDFNGHLGTIDDPYELSNYFDLLQLAANLNFSDTIEPTLFYKDKHFVLTNDIVINDWEIVFDQDSGLLIINNEQGTFAIGSGLTGNIYNTESPSEIGALYEFGDLGAELNEIETVPNLNIWQPIGQGYNHFAGSINGNGHFIKGLYINNSEVDNQAFLNQIQGAKIYNLGFESCVVIGGKNSSTIVSNASDSVISSCYVDGVVLSNNTKGNTAGICAESTNSTFKDCVNDATVIGYKNVAGILASNNLCTVTNCVNYGHIEATRQIIGGIVARNYDGIVINCINFGDCSGDKYIGGICGVNDSSGIVENCSIINALGSPIGLDSRDTPISGNTNFMATMDWLCSNENYGPSSLNPGNENILAWAEGYPWDIDETWHITQTGPRLNIFKFDENINNDTVTYTVKYFFENIENDEYTLGETRQLSGNVGDVVVITPDNFTGFNIDLNSPLQKMEGSLTQDGLLELELYYERDIFEVSFIVDADVELIQGELKQYIKYQGSAKLPIVQRTGYTFAGWDCANEDASYNFINQSITFNASWSADSYNITYLDTDGSVLNLLPTKHIYGIDTNLPTPQKDGYIFNGWEFNGKLIDKVSSNSILSDIVLYASWLPITTKIIFDYGEADSTNLPKSIDAIYGNTIDNLPNPILDEMKFMGWYYGESIITEGSVSYFLEDVTLVAKWSPELLLEVNLDGGTWSKPTCYSGIKDDKIPLIIPQKAGYDFAEWAILSGSGEIDANYFVFDNTNAVIVAKWTPRDGIVYKTEYYIENLDDSNYTLYDIYESTGTTGETIEFSDLYINGFTLDYDNVGNILSGTIAGDGGLVLKVYYKRIVFKVTFNITQGITVLSGDLVQNIKFGGSATIPTIQKTGYNTIGNGWQKDSGDGDLNNVIDDLIYSPILEPKRFIIYYENSSDIEYTFGESKPLYHVYGVDSFISVPTREGYQFLGWQVNDGDIIWDTLDGLSYLDHIHLKALWDINEYTIYFDINLEAYPEIPDLDNLIKPQSMTKVHGVPLIIGEYSQHPYGYSLVGWSETPSDVDNLYSVGDYFNLDQDSTLYAIWEKKTVTISFDSPSKTNFQGDCKSVSYLDEIGELPEPNDILGKSFVGWYILVNNEKFFLNQNFIVTYEEDFAVFSEWENLYYTVTIDLNDGEFTEDFGSLTFSTYYTNTIELPTPQKAGYVFSNWIIEGEGYHIDNNKLTIGYTDATISANWVQNKYNVYFDANYDGSSIIMKSQLFMGNEAKPLSKCEFNRYGYTFVGWSTSPYDSTIEYKDEAIVCNVTADSEITLYAVWSENKNNISESLDNNYITNISCYSAAGFNQNAKLDVELLTGDQISNLPSCANDKYAKYVIDISISVNSEPVSYSGEMFVKLTINPSINEYNNLYIVNSGSLEKLKFNDLGNGNIEFYVSDLNNAVRLVVLEDYESHTYLIWLIIPILIVCILAFWYFKVRNNKSSKKLTLHNGVD